MNPDLLPQLRPLFHNLEVALIDAGNARLAAWARLRHTLIGHGLGQGLPDPVLLTPMMWAARDESPSDPEVLAGTVLRRSYPRVWEVAYNLWLLPEGEPREAVRAILARITAITGEDLHPGTPRRHAELLKAVEALEQTLFEAGQRTAVAACAAFRLNLDRFWLGSWTLSCAFRDWHALAGTPVRSWAWLCMGDASGFAEHVRAAAPDLTDLQRASVKAALAQLLVAAGLPPDASSEAHHQAQRSALIALAEAATARSSRSTQVLLSAMIAAFDGNTEAAMRMLDGRTGLRHRQRLADQAHIALADLPWLVSRVRRSIRGPQAHAALHTVEDRAARQRSR